MLDHIVVCLYYLAEADNTSVLAVFFPCVYFTQPMVQSSKIRLPLLHLFFVALSVMPPVSYACPPAYWNPSATANLNSANAMRLTTYRQQAPGGYTFCLADSGCDIYAAHSGCQDGKKFRLGTG